jgi:lysine 2,3-aminomutase
MRQLRGRVSGLCQPHYMLDIPGGYGKSPIGPNYLTEWSPSETYWITDYKGQPHFYPPEASEPGEMRGMDRASLKSTT